MKLFPTKIWVANTYINIKPSDGVISTRRLTSFCCYACIRNALVKAQGGWYWIRPDGIMERVDTRLVDITFQDVYTKAKEDITYKSTK